MNALVLFPLPFFHSVCRQVEKAHADVFNVLLQILDDGRVTDSQGRVVSFKNAVLIMTSNLGSSAILESERLGANHEEVKEQVRSGTLVGCERNMEEKHFDL